MFSGGLLSLDPGAFEEAIQGLPYIEFEPTGAATAAGTAVAAGILRSNGEARRLIEQGGLYVNDKRVTGLDEPLPDPVHGHYWLLRTGKKNVSVLGPRRE